MQPIVTGFFHEPSQTVSYVVAEPNGHHCAVIDAVLDYDPGRGRTSTTAADAIVAVVQTRGLTVDWVLETHAHADPPPGPTMIESHPVGSEYEDSNLGRDTP